MLQGIGDLDSMDKIVLVRADTFEKESGPSSLEHTLKMHHQSDTF